MRAGGSLAWPLGTALILVTLGSALLLRAALQGWGAEERQAQVDVMARKLADQRRQEAGERRDVLSAAVARSRQRGLEEGRLRARAGDSLPIGRREEWEESRARETGRVLAELEAQRQKERHLAFQESALEGNLSSFPWEPVIVLVSALGALALCTAFILRERVSRPARALASVMREVAAGGERRVPPSGVAALREAGVAFNATVDALTGVRANLEARVDQKTAALARALEGEQRLNEERRRVLAALEEAQEKILRQQKMAALGTLVGGIAHEFNNILGGIRGCGEDLLQDVEEGGPRGTVEVILRAARRGRSVVEGLQHFSQGRPGVREVVDLAALAREVVAAESEAASVRGVDVVLQADDGCRLRADPVEVRHVVANLARNAIQASGPGDRVDVRIHESAEMLMLEVKDRGRGLPEGVESRILEPFFTTRESEGGVGLGLAVVHGIVDALGGSLEFRRRSEGGTTFQVALPRAPDDDQEGSA